MEACILPGVWQPCLQGQGADIFSDPKQGVQSICGPTSLSTVAVDASFGCWFVGRGTKTLDQYSKGDLCFGGTLLVGSRLGLKTVASSTFRTF